MNTAMKQVYLITALSLSTITVVYADNTSTSTSSSTPASSGAPASSSASTLLGDYTCKRTDATNNTVSYPLTISKTSDTYTFEWDDSSGNPVLYGTGVMHPNLANVISASFWDPTKPNTIGIEMFELKPDGTLQANWVLQADNKLGSELCTKNK